MRKFMKKLVPYLISFGSLILIFLYFYSNWHTGYGYAKREDKAQLLNAETQAKDAYDLGYKEAMSEYEDKLLNSKRDVESKSDEFYAEGYQSGYKDGISGMRYSNRDDNYELQIECYVCHAVVDNMEDIKFYNFTDENLYNIPVCFSCCESHEFQTGNPFYLNGHAHYFYAASVDK